MKKSLIALAVLGTFAGAASAQGAVTVAGVAKAGVAQFKYSGVGSGLAVYDGSSQFHIRGSEDLGGGLTASFQIDTRFRFDEGGGTLAGGNTWIGLSGGFGNLQVGRLDTHYTHGIDTHNVRATATAASSVGLLAFMPCGGVMAATNPCGGAGANAIAGATRTNNVIRYTTPTMGGLTAQVNYSTAFAGSEGNAGGAGKGRAIHGQLIFSQGPIRAGVSLWDANGESRLVGATNADERSYRLFGDYRFGTVSVGLTFDESKRFAGALPTRTETKRRAWSVPVTVSVGTGTLLATYTQADDVRVAGATVADSGASLISVGYDYPLSRRTSLGVSYARLNNDARANYNLFGQNSLGGVPLAGAGVDTDQLYFGVRHTF